MKNRRIEDRLTALEILIHELNHQAELIKTVLVVKEPESTLAAGAFEGLRKQIVTVAQEHWTHLAQLAIIDVAANHVEDVNELRRVSEEWLTQAGVQKVHRLAPDASTEMWELVGHGPDVLEVLQPAYIDSETGRIIKAGRLMRGDRRRTPTATDDRASSEPETTSSVPAESGEEPDGGPDEHSDEQTDSAHRGSAGDNTKPVPNVRSERP